MALLRGFILQPTYRIESGVPIVHLYGRLEDGRPFLVRDRRPAPALLRRAGRRRAGAGSEGRAAGRHGDKVTLVGRPVVRVELGARGRAALRDRLAEAGIATYEADVRFAIRYLIDRGIRGSLEIRGEPREVPGLGVVFDDPDVAPADWTPRLSRALASTSRRTRPRAGSSPSRLHGCGVSEVLLLTPPGRELSGRALGRSRPRRSCWRASAARVRELDPDVLTGWNVVDFDLAVLDRLAVRCACRSSWAAGPGALRLRTSGRSARDAAGDDPGPRGARRHPAPARRVRAHGGLQPRRGRPRGAGRGQDAVAAADRAAGDPAPVRGGPRAARRLQPHGRPPRARDPRAPARWWSWRSSAAGSPACRSIAWPASIAAFDFLYLRELGRRRDRRAERPRRVGAGGAAGRRARARAAARALHERRRARLPEPVPEPHPHVRDRPPEPRARREAGRQRAGPDRGAERRRFRAAQGILGEILDELCRARGGAARGRHGEEPGDQDPDELVLRRLGTPACRFYDPRLANAITGFGREMLLWCKRTHRGRAARACSTATPTACSWSRARRRPRRRGPSARRWPSASTASSRSTSRARWRVESRLELAFDRLYLRLCLPAMRHGTAGARKRYAGLVEARGRARGRLHRHGGRARRLDRARQGGAARAVRAAVRRASPCDEYLRGGRRAAARGAARRAARLPQGAAQSRPRPTPPRRRPTWPPPARSRQDAAAASRT